MLHINDEFIKEHLLDGAFGLEKENLRVLSDGSFSHTKHPAPGDDHIVRDFCENQIEINTDPYGSAEEAVAALRKQEKKILIKAYADVGELGDCLRVSIGEKQYMQKLHLHNHQHDYQ